MLSSPRINWFKRVLGFGYVNLWFKLAMNGIENGHFLIWFGLHQTIFSATFGWSWRNLCSLLCWRCLWNIYFQAFAGGDGSQPIRARAPWSFGSRSSIQRKQEMRESWDSFLCIRDRWYYRNRYGLLLLYDTAYSKLSIRALRIIVKLSLHPIQLNKCLPNFTRNLLSGLFGFYFHEVMLHRPDLRLEKLGPHVMLMLFWRQRVAWWMRQWIWKEIRVAGG